MTPQFEGTGTGSRAMRIAIPIHSFEPGGVERVALRLAQRWQDAGQDVVVVLGRNKGPCRSVAPDLDYRTIREPIPTALWETLWMIYSLWRFLRRERVDVLFCSGNTYAIVCLAMKVLLRRRCPPVVIKISNDLRRRDMFFAGRPFYRAWLRLQGRAFDRFVAMADPLVAEVVEEMRVARDRIAVIPDPSLSADDMDAMEPSAAPRSRRAMRFLSIGRLFAQKNQRLMISALARHAGENDSLTLLGDGGLRGSLEALAARLGVADRVVFAGHVNDIKPYLAASDALVLSSDYEGLPAVVPEALAAGLPLVTTRSSAAMDWLAGDGRFGIVVPVGDEDAFGKALQDIRNLDPPIAQMRAFAAGFTLERSAPDYITQMRRVAYFEKKSTARSLRVTPVRGQ